MRIPVLIYLDFEKAIVARYLGRTRTMRCTPTEGSVGMRAWDWNQALQEIRYTPKLVDPNHPAEGA